MEWESTMISYIWLRKGPARSMCNRCQGFHETPRDEREHCSAMAGFGAVCRHDVHESEDINLLITDVKEPRHFESAGWLHKRPASAPGVFWHFRSGYRGYTTCPSIHLRWRTKGVKMFDEILMRGGYGERGDSGDLYQGTPAFKSNRLSQGRVLNIIQDLGKSEDKDEDDE
ncbi:unnamed protein product [Orchesella dallaii]|uniref:Uncharacterized protein n=1 Tax=Orchesella dallaii TaxID=48710 RepID=A0ABP1Q3M5_9HEXA